MQWTLLYSASSSPGTSIAASDDDKCSPAPHTMVLGKGPGQPLLFCLFVSLSFWKSPLHNLWFRGGISRYQHSYHRENTHPPGHGVRGGMDSCRDSLPIRSCCYHVSPLLLRASFPPLGEALVENDADTTGNNWERETDSLVMYLEQLGSTMFDVKSRLDFSVLWACESQLCLT